MFVNIRSEFEVAQEIIILILRCQKQKIAVEFDGPSHHSKERRIQDARKTATLKKLGWIVIRVPHD